jgi:CheY-like chemotaxis protein
MGKKILLADDYLDLVETYAEMIKRNFGIESDCVSNPSDLVNRAKTGNYSIVFSDNDMQSPMKLTNDGLRAVSELREAKIKIPFYIISGRDIEEEALKAGATGFIRKKDLDEDLCGIFEKKLRAHGLVK